MHVGRDHEGAKDRFGKSRDANIAVVEHGGGVEEEFEQECP